MSKPIIQVQNISKSYRIGKKESYGSLRDEIMQTITSPFRRASMEEDEDSTIWALKDVSFEVKEGEVLGIIGRNGAGKSTLLKILSRITEPTSGRITMRGRVASLLEVGTGFHPELTGRENILLNGALLGMTRQEIKSKFDEIVAFAEIEKFLDTPVKRYSSGMYVRLAFAVAAHLEPEILIVDEVLAVGDAGFQKKCLGKMGEVAKGGRTVLFVSHNMAAVSTFCTKAVLLEYGQMLNSGDTRDIIEQYLSHLKMQSDTACAEMHYESVNNATAQIISVRISDNEGNTTLCHDILSPINIEIEFVVNKYFPDLVVAIAIKNQIGEVLFTSNDMDWLQIKGKHNELSSSKEPGIYKALLVLPLPIFNAGIYELEAVVGVPGRGRIDFKGGFMLELEARSDFMAVPYKRHGVLAMPIEWKVTH